MDTIVFSNRMGASNLIYIAIAYAIAGCWLLFTDTDPLLTLSIIAALLVASYALVAAIIAFNARKQVAELIETPAGLRVEMVHLLGKGRQFILDPADVQSWQLKGGGTKYATIRLITAAQPYHLPVYGAKILDREAIGRLAGPEIAAPLERQRALTPR